MIEIIPHGPLAIYGKMKVAAKTAAEAIEAWSRQCGMTGQPVIEAVDFDSEEKLFAPTRKRKIHLVPAMIGGGGVGKIIVGAALIAFAVVNPFGFGAAVTAAIISSGASLMVMGVAELFMKAPKIQKEEEVEASRYLGTGRNSTAIGTVQGIGGGRMLVGGHFLSVQVNSSDMVYGRFPATPT